MRRSLSQQFSDHERMDAERFKALEETLACIPTREEMQGFIAFANWLNSSRKAVIYFGPIIVFLGIIGAVYMAVKGLFR